MADPVFQRVSLVLKAMAQHPTPGLSTGFIQSMSEITPSPISELDDDLGMGFLERVEFVMDLEDEFQISIPDEISEQWVRLQDVIESIKKIQILK